MYRRRANASFNCEERLAVMRVITESSRPNVSLQIESVAYRFYPVTKVPVRTPLLVRYPYPYVATLKLESVLVAVIRWRLSFAE